MNKKKDPVKEFEEIRQQIIKRYDDAINEYKKFIRALGFSELLGEIAGVLTFGLTKVVEGVKHIIGLRSTKDVKKDAEWALKVLMGAKERFEKLDIRKLTEKEIKNLPNAIEAEKRLLKVAIETLDAYKEEFKGNQLVLWRTVVATAKDIINLLKKAGETALKIVKEIPKWIKFAVAGMLGLLGLVAYNKLREVV